MRIAADGHYFCRGLRLLVIFGAAAVPGCTYTSTSGTPSPANIVLCSGVAVLRDVMPPVDPDERFAIIMGRIQALNGDPLHRAMVRVHAPELPTPRATFSDSSGVFRLDSIPPGERIVRIQLLGFQTQDHHVNIRAGTREAICAVMQHSS